MRYANSFWAGRFEGGVFIHAAHEYRSVSTRGYFYDDRVGVELTSLVLFASNPSKHIFC